MLLFNVVLTSLPVIALGVFEQDVSSEICLQVSFHIPPSLSFWDSYNQFTVKRADLPTLMLFITVFYLFVFTLLEHHCSFQHYINKDQETSFSTGTESSVGWETVSTVP